VCPHLLINSLSLCSYGRKFVINVSLIPLIIVALGTAFAHTPLVYYVTRFIAGFLSFGITNTLFVTLVENSEGRHKELLAVGYSLSTAVGVFGKFLISDAVNGAMAVGLVLVAMTVVFAGAMW
jgi:MFS family permease